MNEFYNRHYITVDTQNRIVNSWSDGPHPNMSTTDAICINEKGGYQFRLVPGGEENPPLYTMDGISMYKWDGNKPVLRSDTELNADRSAIPASPPSTIERLEAQITYTAMITDTLLG